VATAAATGSGANTAVIAPTRTAATAPAARDTSIANAMPSFRLSEPGPPPRMALASGSGTSALATIPTVPTSICPAAYCPNSRGPSRWAIATVQV
jgi:hypothetical protein